VAVPTGRALSAIAVAARERNLPVDGMRVLRDATNVLAHLEPAPVVARAPITLARLRPKAWFEQEVRLAQFLVNAGAPVAPPSEDVDPGPAEHYGLLVTFWKHVDHDPGRFDPEVVGQSLRNLHSALADYDEALPAFDRLEEIRALLESLRPSSLASADDLAELRLALGRLGEPPRDGWRPLHGDSHFNNVLWSREGPLWTDLENACLRPVEYDLACLLWRGAPGTDAAVGAYGPYDAGLVARLEPFLAVFLAAWTIAVVERNPSPGARAELRWRIERAAAVRPG
jgi:Phosphotransferase enzyme family